MKVVLLFMLLVCGVFGGSLKDAANELMELLPMDKLKQFADKHLKNNGDVQKIMTYLKTADFQQLVTQVRATPSTKELEKYLQDEGIETNEIVNTAEEFISSSEVGENGNLKLTDAITELISILPMDRIRSFVLSHITDPWFVTLLGMVRKVIEGLSSVPLVQPLINHIKEAGLLKLIF